MKGTVNPPFAYRLEHRTVGSQVVLERTTSFAAAILLVNVWAERLRAAGADGSIVVREEAFHTVVARHPLFPANRRFDGGHASPPAPTR